MMLSHLFDVEGNAVFPDKVELIENTARKVIVDFIMSPKAKRRKIAGLVGFNEGEAPTMIKFIKGPVEVQAYDTIHVTLRPA